MRLKIIHVVRVEYTGSLAEARIPKENRVWWLRGSECYIVYCISQQSTYYPKVKCARGRKLNEVKEKRSNQGQNERN